MQWKTDNMKDEDILDVKYRIAEIENAMSQEMWEAIERTKSILLTVLVILQIRSETFCKLREVLQKICFFFI